MAEASFPALAAASAWAGPGTSTLPIAPDAPRRWARAKRSVPRDLQRWLSHWRRQLAMASPGPEPLDLSVVICTYNGMERLPRVLDCLLAQVGLEQQAWEVIVVHNNSTDGTAQVVDAYRQRWPQPIPLRYAFEARQGAGYARQHGVKIACGSLVAFLDDDNHPALGWVVAAHRFGQVPRPGDPRNSARL